MKKVTILLCAIAIAMGAYAAPKATQTTTDEGWSEWEPFAPLGLSTGTYTMNIVADFVQTTVPVEVRTNLTDPTHKQIKMSDWGKIVYAYSQEVIVDWFTTNDSCFFHATTMYDEDDDEMLYEDVAAWDEVSHSHYDSITATFSFNLMMSNSRIIRGPLTETLEMNRVYTERDTVDINLNDVAIYGIGDDLGYFHYIASDDDMFVNMYLLGNEPFGTFSVQNTTLDIKTVVNGYNTKDGEVTVTKGDGLITVTGWIIGQDEVYYRLHLTSKTGGLNGDEQEKDISSVSCWADCNWGIEEGGVAYIEMSGQSSLGATNALLLLFVSDTATMIPAGEYPISDTHEVGTALKSTGIAYDGAGPCYIEVPKMPHYLNWYMQSGTVTISYDQYGKMKVLVDAQNSYGKKISMVAKYEKLEPKKTVDIIADNLTAPYRASSNDYHFRAETDEYVINILTREASFRTPAGDYKDHAIDFTPSSQIVKKGTPYMETFFDCEFTVTMDGSDISLTGWALGRDTVRYNLKFTGTITGIVRETNQDYSGTFDLDKAISEQPEEYTVRMSVTNDKREKVVLYFVSANIVDLDIPVDIYRIDSAIMPVPDEHMVFPSQGIDGDEITYSYVATLDEQGEPKDIWYIEAGQVVVADDGSITVDAVNSLYKSIRITITAKSTGLESVDGGQCTMHNGKYIRNGQLIIRKGGKAFGAGGAELR
ncbi:MAG: hypothetical protein MJZ55_01060 [Paludibacteraceae bacterium]|nr:hypothetical protein [Paludibacteraceae bacterium]